MADKYCPNCGAGQDGDAKLCSNCGSKFPEAAPKKSSIGVGRGCLIAVGVLIGLPLIASLIVPHSNTKSSAPATQAPPPETPAQKAEKAVQDLRTKTAMAAGQALRDAARNPDSLVIEGAAASDDGKILCVKYRAENGFGGTNRESVAFENGVTRSSAAFWNKHCPNAQIDETQNVKFGVQFVK